MSLVRTTLFFAAAFFLGLSQLQAGLVTINLFDGDRVTFVNGATVNSLLNVTNMESGDDLLTTINLDGDLDGLGMTDDMFSVVIRQAGVDAAGNSIDINDTVNRLGETLPDGGTLLSPSTVFPIREASRSQTMHLSLVFNHSPCWEHKVEQFTMDIPIRLNQSFGLVFTETESILLEAPHKSHTSLAIAPHPRWMLRTRQRPLPFSVTFSFSSIWT